MQNAPLKKGNFDGLDYRLLLGNTFQQVWHTATIDSTFPLLIQYVGPYEGVNKTYINWLTSNINQLREYCLFTVTKLHFNFHLDWNLIEGVFTVSELSLRFENYVQKVLYNPSYAPIFAPLISYDFSDIPNVSLGPESKEFLDLVQIYDRDSVDITLYPLNVTKQHLTSVRHLLQKGLITPYVEVKNTRLNDEYMFIVPNVDLQQQEILMRIFRFFNYCLIYEIHGEQYVNGMEHLNSFSRGLFIRVFLSNPWIPDCDPYGYTKILRALEKVFRLINVSHAIILYSMVDGEYFVKNIYQDTNELINRLKSVPLAPMSIILPNCRPPTRNDENKEKIVSLFDSYNPLTNLRWNKILKRWQNHALFTQKFEARYPNLLYGLKYMAQKNNKL
jgi:hypothetical protein